MAEPRMEQPDLYGLDEQGALVLFGVQCEACGYTSFPPQYYGCEACGAAGDRLIPVSFAGGGVLLSFAAVHFHHDPGYQVPFIIAVIRLDDGPVLRGEVSNGNESGLSIGERVKAVLIPSGRDGEGRGLVRLAFELSPEAQNG